MAVENQYNMYNTNYILFNQNTIKLYLLFRDNNIIIDTLHTILLRYLIITFQTVIVQ